MLLPKRWSIVMLAMVSLLFVHCTGDEQRDSTDQFKPFYGSFAGKSQKTNTGEIAERDLAVTIKPWGHKGFTIEWSTVIYRDGRDKETNMSINFYQSPRPGVFAPAMRTDVFGSTVPYDPIDAAQDPYVWAGLNGSTLTVTALYIIDGGSYEMQVYKRSLHEAGLLLEFERVKDGERISQISSILERTQP